MDEEPKKLTREEYLELMAKDREITIEINNLLKNIQRLPISRSKSSKLSKLRDKIFEGLDFFK